MRGNDQTRLSHGAAATKISDELITGDYRVFEALAISKVLYLQEHENENIDAVIIDSSVEPRGREIRYIPGIILTLEPGATAAYVQWELSLLFSGGSSTVQ